MFGAAKWIVRQFKDQDTFEQALLNPNSFFLARGDIVAVQTHYKWSQGNAIQLATLGATCMLCQDIAGHSDTLVDLWRVGKSMLTKQWQPEFVQRLNECLDRAEGKHAA